MRIVLDRALARRIMLSMSAADNDQARVTVLLPRELFTRFHDFCDRRGLKKSTLLARIIAELVEGEGTESQGHLFPVLREKARK